MVADLAVARAVVVEMAEMAVETAAARAVAAQSRRLRPLVTFVLVRVLLLQTLAGQLTFLQASCTTHRPISG